MKTTILLAACAAILTGTAGHAAVVSLTYDLTGSNFVQSFGPVTASSPPVDPLKLNFTLTFDTMVDTLDGVTDGLTVNSFNLPYALRYTYIAGEDALIIGTDPIPYGACATFSLSSDTFCAFIDDASTLAASVTYDAFNGTYLLSLGTRQSQFDAQTAALVVTAPVPEPAGWAMMTAGFGLTGLALRRRGPGRSAFPAARRRA